MEGYIYKIVNDINDKIYVGKTIKAIEERFKEHLHSRNKETCEKRPLYNAMNYYGIEHFKIELIEKCDLLDLSNREIYWIDYYDSYRYGYNATKGGDGKILYDYNDIIQLYNKGYTCNEIVKKINCSQDVITLALKIAGIDSKTNMIQKSSKPIIAIFSDSSELKFNSRSDAARWLLENNYTNSTIKNIVTNIGRVAEGKEHRKSYLNIVWKNGE